MTTAVITKDEISFLTHSNSYCVCFVDMIDSTNIIAQIAIPDKVRKYYSIFLNSMSALIKKFGGSIIKNLGDSLVFYFRYIVELELTYDIICSKISFYPVVFGNCNDLCSHFLT